MKTIVILIALLFVNLNAQSQNLEAFNSKRLKVNKSGMKILGAWAITNMAISPVLRNQVSGSDKYFYDMNLYWNAVNLLIAGVGYIGAVKDDPSGYSLKSSLKEQHAIEKILLFNMALDVGYVVTGFYLDERGTRKNNLRLQGYGDSLKLQGAFLAVFDLFFYLAHHKNATQLYNILDTVSPATNGIGLSVRFNL